MITAKRPTNIDALNRINSRLSLIDIAVTGFWFCRGCQRITELEDSNEGGMRCSICGSFNVRHHLPVFTPEENERFKSKTLALDRSRH